MQACIDLMRPITDPASAQAAVDDIKPTFEEVGTAMADMMAHLQNPGAVLANLTEMQRLQNDMMRLDREFNAEIDRLTALKGLPVEFWNVFRVESNRLGRTLVQSAAAGNPSIDQSVVAAVVQSAAMYDQFTPDRIVEFELTNASGGDPDAATERLQAIAGDAAQVVSMSDPEDYDVVHVTVAPVDDFDKLIAAVDFGTVVDSEKAKGAAKVELPNMTEADNDAALAETEGDAAYTDAGAETDATVAPEVATTDGGRGEYYGGRGEYDGGRGEYAAVPDSAGAPQASGDTANASGSIPFVARPGGAAPQESGLAAAGTRLRDWMGALGAAGAQGRDMTALQPIVPGEPLPTDPNYHAQLAELLHDSQSQFHEQAVLALLTVQPNDVADKKVRQRIAQGYRYVAFETNAHADEAVQGLVHWGGVHSVPLLVELLGGGGGAGGMERGGGGPVSEQAIYDGLAKFATPEAATAIATRLSESATSGDAAFECLRTMGVVAEAPLLKVLPFESPEANLSAVGVLGDVGTKKSIAVLRRAAKSENADIVDAALGAIRAIQERERAAAAAAKADS